MKDEVLSSFERYCNLLAKTPSRAEKSRILCEAVRHSGVAQLFSWAISPYHQFFLQEPLPDLDYECANITYKEFEYLVLALQKRLPISVQPGKLGKWLCRVLNKNLAIGVGIGSLLAISQSLVRLLPLAIPVGVELTPDEPWEALVHHIGNSTDWYIQGDPYGIRTLIHYDDSKIFPYSETGIPLRNFDVIDKEFQRLFADKVLTFDCKLWVEGETASNDDHYKQFTRPLEVGDESRLRCTILTKIPHCITEYKAEEESDAFLTEFFSNQEKGIIRYSWTQQANFRDSDQLAELRIQGYKKALLRNYKSAYHVGKNVESLLSIKL